MDNDKNKKIILIVKILSVIIIFWGLYEIIFKNLAPLPGEAVAIQGQEHIKIGEKHPAYNSVPPTSGWHFEDPAKWGVHNEPIVDEIQVHNLEHGGILVQYKPDLATDDIDELKRIVSKYDSDIILAPYPNLDKNIALTAWGRIDKFERPDEERIDRFYRAFVDKGPEHITD